MEKKMIGKRKIEAGLCRELRRGFLRGCVEARKGFVDLFFLVLEFHWQLEG